MYKFKVISPVYCVERLDEMSKPRYAQIIVRSEVRARLEKLAGAQGYQSINQFLESILYGCTRG